MAVADIVDRQRTLLDAILACRAVIASGAAQGFRAWRLWWWVGRSTAEQAELLRRSQSNWHSIVAAPADGATIYPAEEFDVLGALFQQTAARGIDLADESKLLCQKEPVARFLRLGLLRRLDRIEQEWRHQLLLARQWPSVDQDRIAAARSESLAG